MTQIIVSLLLKLFNIHTLILSSKREFSFRETKRNRCSIFRNEENPPIHVVNETSWETNTQVSRPSEDQYTRPDSNSSKSTDDEPVTSTRSNIYNPTTIHQQILEPNFHRVISFLPFLIFSTSEN